MHTHKSIYEAFAAQAAMTPDSPAVSDGTESYTYAELEQLVAAIAERFPAGMKRAAIVMNHSALMIASVLAVLRQGAAYVPFEPDYPASLMRERMKQANVDTIVADCEYADAMGELARVVVPSGEWTCDSTVLPAPADSEAAAYVLFHAPDARAVVVSNSSALDYLNSLQNQLKIRTEDVILQNGAVSGDTFVGETFGTLLNGAKLAVAPVQTRENTALLTRFMQDQNVTILSIHPYLAMELNRLDRLPQTVRLVVCSGDVLRSKHIDRILEQAEVWNRYGTHASSIGATYFRCTEDGALSSGVFPVGYPALGSSVLVIDEDGTPQRRGYPGEIVILEDGDSDSFMSDMEIGGKRAFCTGDIGYVAEDGALVFMRRKDAHVMIRGRRVETGEIENILCGIDGICTAYVRASEDESGMSYLTAYIVPDDPEITVRSIKRELKASLPDHMIPEFFIKMNDIPVTPDGSPDFESFPVVMKEGRL